VVAVNVQIEVEYLNFFFFEPAHVSHAVQVVYSDLRIMTKLTGPRVAIVICVVYLHSTAHLTT